MSTAPAPPRDRTQATPAPAGDPEPPGLRAWIIPADNGELCHALVHRTLSGFRHTLCGLPVEPPHRSPTHRWTGTCPYEVPTCPACGAAGPGGGS